MGGLWVDYNLQSTIPGLFVAGEANFSDHGANRLGASALMQGLADGYFVIPYTVGNYLGELGISEAGFSNTQADSFEQGEVEVKQRINQFMNTKGTRSPRSFHKELGQIIWNYCGMSRNQAGLNEAIENLQKLKEEFWQNVLVVGKAAELNAELERAGRVADFIEFGELMSEIL